MDEPGAGGGLDLEALLGGVEEAVRAAGEAIIEVCGRGRIWAGLKGSDGPVTEADHAADDVLHARLMQLIPGAQWLSEESQQVAPLIHGEPTWVVDPLDGTREFLRGLAEFGVSAALFVDDRLVLGAICLPTDGTVLGGLVNGERNIARRNGEPLAPLPEDGNVGRVVVSRHDYEWRQLHYHIPFPAYPCGSAAVKLAHVVDGRAGVYLSTGPRSVWDAAGGAAVLRAAGGELLMFNGQPLELSPQQVRIPPFAAGPRERALALLRGLGARI